jgi:2-polyprenyl-3-methyl-5-hydroxy-6-metoxy-1,4-benzoquinol methylase
METVMQEHWEKIYSTKAPDQVSWFRPHLETSLALIERTAHNRSAIIDVGGGASTLIDDLIQRGYRNLTVLDISQAALAVAESRLGKAASLVRWIRADVTRVDLPKGSFDVWHDRAVFHFLMAVEDRAAYIRTLTSSIKPGAQVLISTFGPEGPIKCSGLDVRRYDADSLQNELGAQFYLIESSTEFHTTPFGTTQQFLYCHFTFTFNGRVLRSSDHPPQ